MKMSIFAVCFLMSSFSFANHPNCDSHCKSVKHDFWSKDKNVGCPSEPCKCGPSEDVKNCKSHKTLMGDNSLEGYHYECTYSAPHCPEGGGGL